MKRREYYKSEIFRVAMFPLVFVVIVLLLANLGLPKEIYDPDDLRIYFGVAIIGLGASLLLYFITYRHKWFRRK